MEGMITERNEPAFSYAEESYLVSIRQGKKNRIRQIVNYAGTPLITVSYTETASFISVSLSPEKLGASV